MSPIGNSPSASGEAEGDKERGCTYIKKSNQTDQQPHQGDGRTRRYAVKEKTTPSTNSPNIVHNQKQQNRNPPLDQTPRAKSTSIKPRRNSEQRIPGKKTLKEYFPIIQHHTQRKTTAVILETPQYWLQRVKQQTSYRAKAKRVITPTESAANRNKPNQRGRNHYGTKTNRSIAMEFKAEQARKTVRQSKIYDSDMWFQKEEDKLAATTFFGHSMQQIDNTSVYRVLLQNTNGIDPNPNNYDFQFSLNTCFDQCVAFASLTETNTEWNNYVYRDQLRDSLKKWWDGAAFQTSTSSIPFTEKYKPGGTVSIVFGNHWVARIREKGDDDAGLGRFTYVGLQGNQHTKLLHITWYHLCKQGLTTAGEKTAFKQQYMILREKFPDQEIEPRRQSVLDMQQFITKKQKEGYFIILSTDGNENLSGNKFSFCPLDGEGSHSFNKDHDGLVLTLINSCGLVDILKLQHNSEQYPATYIRGRSRIDGIFVSHQIVPAVLRTGLTPFHTFFANSDHRAVYVDFAADLLFNSNTYELVRQKGRGLQLRDPRIVDAYILSLFEQLEYHKVMKKLERLVRIKVEDWKDSDRITYEKLDRIITESMIYAESSCAKRYSTRYHWSPLLLQAVYAYRYARLRLKAANNLPVTQKTILYHQKQAKITDEQHKELQAIDQIVKFLRETKARMREHQRKHEELRKEYVESLAEAMVFKRFPTIEKATGFFEEQKASQLKALSNRESARAMHRKIRVALNRTQGGGTIRIDVPDATVLFSPDGKSYGDPENPKEWKGPWSVITEPEEMEKHIIAANTKQYHQAHITPFAQEPLASLFGPDGTTPFAQNFLGGTALPQNIFSQLQPETQRILNTLQLPASQRYDTEAVITPSKFISCYKTLDEKISSSLSTRHVGHYKSILDKPSLVDLHCQMMTLPYKHGFAVERWKSAVDVVLPKDEGKHYIHRHRIIRLVESDYNQSLRILFARPLGFFLEDTNGLPDMQYGSRAGQMSISAVFNKVLSFDLARLLKIVMATEENDAIGCYDRIMQQLVALYLIRMGILIAAITCVCRTFDETIHYIKTAHGIAKATYSATKEVPLYGAGQGTTGGPLFWLITFSLLMEAFDSTMRGMTFSSPCRTITSTRYGDAFVDDTKFGVTTEQPPGQSDLSDESIQAQAQQVLRDLTRISQHYEKLLFGSGGALNIRKCHWVLIAWKWSQGKARMMTTVECPGSLYLTSGFSETPEEVPRLEPNTAYRTLGAYITVTGSMKHAITLYRKKSVEYAGYLGPSNLSRCEAYFSFVLYFYPKLSYALPISSYTQRECTFIQAPAMAALLPKIGLNRHTSKNIIHGPIQYGGLQLNDLYTDQGIGQLRLLIGHLRRGGETSRLLLIAISVMQQRIGSSILFFNLPYPRYEGWTEKTWLTSLWKFLHITNVMIEMSDVPIPKIQREHDFFLMSEFIHLGFKKGDLELINQCRLYHQVFTAADIMVADGTRLDPIYTTNTRHPDRASSLQWPNQGCPSPKAWRKWNSALRHLLRNNRLDCPLGRWTTRPHQEWSWVVRIEDKVLFHKHSTGWERYDPIAKIGVTRSSQKPWYSTTQKRSCRRPEKGIAVATILAENMDGDIFTIIWSAELPPRSIPATNEPPTATSTSSEELDQIPEYLPSFQEKIQSSAYFRRLIGPLYQPREEDLLEIANRIIEGTLLVCSDGSFCPHSGTGSHAWVFSSPEGDVLLRGAGPIDCNPVALSSYRPELGGMTALIYILMNIIHTFDIPSGCVTMFCDNKSALENILDGAPKRGIYPLLEADYDLLLLAKEMLSSMPIKIEGRWVKGHYSGDNRQVEHDLNSLVDTMATQFREHPPPGFHPSAFPLFHRSHKAAAYIEGSMITSKLVQQIYSRRFQKGLEETLCKRNKWTKQTFLSIDWDIFGKVFKSYSRFYQISVVKYVHGLWNTGQQKVLFKQDPHGLCPGCKREVETTHHIFQCTAEEAAAHRTQQLQTLYDYLDEQEIPRPVKQCIYNGIEGWFGSAEEKPVLHAPTRGKLMPADQLATMAFSDQTNIGWEAFLRGHISTSWRKAILLANPIRDEDATELHLRRLIKKLHALSLSIWECRNKILHGDTMEQRKTTKTKLIKDKVTDLYNLYYDGRLPLFARDQYLITKKPLEDRLKGDNDMLMCWLRLLEAAMKAYEVQQAKSQKHADKFFQPFRALGRQRLLESRAATMSQQQEVSTQEAYHDPPTSKISYLQRDEIQLRELSPATQSLSLQRGQPSKPVEGISGTILYRTFEADTEETMPNDRLLTDEYSITEPGPFGQIPLIDQEFTSDSSYTWSRGRDVALSYDTLTDSSATDVTPDGYRAHRRRSTIAKMDQLISHLTLLHRMPESSGTSTATASSSSGNRIDSQVLVEDAARSASILSSSDSESSPASSQLVLHSQDADSFCQKLRFPLHLIADTRQEITQSNPSASIGDNTTIGTRESSASSDVAPPSYHSREICIEEITISNDVSGNTIDFLPPRDFFQLAQDSSLSSQDSEIISCNDNLLNHQDWNTGVWEFTPPSTDSDEHSLASREGYTSIVSRPFLQVLQPPDTSSDSVAAQQVWRSLGAPPMEALDVPPPVPLFYGVIQGLSISPAAYMARDVEAEPSNDTSSDQISIPDSMPSLSPRSVEEAVEVVTLGERAIAPNNGNSIADSASDDYAIYFDSGDSTAPNHSVGSEALDGEDTRSWQAEADGQWEGNTEASTRSFLSQVDVYRLDTNEFQLEGHVIEIPIRELDDPPDNRAEEAASLGRDSEIEHSDSVS